MRAMETFTIREPAERCGVSYQAIRKRVDRGSLEVVRKDGVRLIRKRRSSERGCGRGRARTPLRSSPGCRRRTSACDSSCELRQLPQQVDGEREGRERVKLSLHRERAERTALEQQLRQAEQARAEAAGRLERITSSGFVARQRLLHARAAGWQRACPAGAASETPGVALGRRPAPAARSASLRRRSTGRGSRAGTARRGQVAAGLLSRRRPGRPPATRTGSGATRVHRGP
jgi:hypothetical protein